MNERLLIRVAFLLWRKDVENGESPEMKLKLVSRIQAGELTIEQVPEFYREAVKQVLDEQSNLG